MFRRNILSMAVKSATVNFQRRFAQINIKPPKERSDYNEEIKGLESVATIFVNIALAAAVVGGLQTETCQEYIASHLGEGEIKRRLQKSLSERMAETITATKEILKGGLKASTEEGALINSLLRPVTRSQIVSLFASEGSGFNTQLLGAMDNSSNVLWLECREKQSIAQIIVDGLGGPSYLLTNDSALFQLPEALKNGAKDSKDGLVVILSHADEVNPLVEGQLNEIIRDVAGAAAKAPIRFVLINPSSAHLKNAFLFGNADVIVKTYRGEDDATVSKWLQQERGITPAQAERTLSVCGPDVECSSLMAEGFRLAASGNLPPKSKHHPDTVANRRMRLAGSQLQETLMAGRDPKVQLAQLFLLDCLIDPKVNKVTRSPPELVEIRTLREAAMERLVKFVGRKNLPAGDLRPIFDSALQNLESNGVIWRCSAEGNVLSNAAAEWMCLRNRATVPTWTAMQREAFIKEIKEAALKTIKERK